MSMLPLVADMMHMSVSDHSPLVIQILVAPPATLPRAPWKFNGFWLKLFHSHEGIVGGVHKFFDTQDHNNSIVQQWDAFKAYLRGLVVAELNKVKHTSSALKA